MELRTLKLSVTYNIFSYMFLNFVDCYRIRIYLYFLSVLLYWNIKSPLPADYRHTDKALRLIMTLMHFCFLWETFNRTDRLADATKCIWYISADCISFHQWLTREGAQVWIGLDLDLYL